MGKGLSELQKRILVYAAEGSDCLGGNWWFDLLMPDEKPAVGGKILPDKSRWRTACESASVSRALRRLEIRGLIVRVRGRARRRTEIVIPTPLGAQVAASLAAGNSGHFAMALARHLAKHPE